MARQHLGKALSGGVIALCVILLLTPVTHSQGARAMRQKFTISGNVGLPGVTMQGLPGAPTTNENGVYSAEVEYGTSFTVTPVKLGYTFEPTQIVYENVEENKTEENYVGTLLTFTVSGSVGMPGVTMQGLPGEPVSGADGRYTATVTYGFTNTVTPVMTGYRFDPPSKLYDQVTADQLQNYAPHELTFPISGSVGVDGVTMKGLPGNPVTAGGGLYRVEAPYNWRGKVTPMKEGHEFSPPDREYLDVTGPMTDQDYVPRVYTFQITGTTGLPGVMLKGLPDEPITDTTGFYTATVPYGWKGTVTPFRAGWTFTPPTKSYTKVTSSYENQDYASALVQLTISGNAGTPGVVMEGLPGNPTTDATGFYTAKVEYGWTGTITPVKEGYSFNPSNSVVSSVTNDMPNSNFKASPVTFTIAGNVGLKGAVLEGLPGRPVSGADGQYSAQVPYKFSGTVTPRMSGYTFEPAKRDYVSLTESKTSETYMYQILQHAISGRIISSEDGSPVAGVAIQATQEGGSVMTDTDGNYVLSVNHGWQGTITPIRDGFTFSPTSRLIEPMVQPKSNVGFVGKVKTLTITDSIVFGEGPTAEPIQGVTVTAEPGGNSVVTDAKGKYSIPVPYGWTGELVFFKKGFLFDPASIAYADVFEDIDKTAPPVTAPPVTAPPVTTPPVTTPPVTAPPVTTPPATAPPVTTETDPEVERLRRERDALLAELGRPTTPPVTTLPPATPTTLPPVTPTVPDNRSLLGPTSTLSLLDVLAWMQDRTGVKIAVDATVKPDPVSVTFDLNSINAALVPAALAELLKGTNYKSMQKDDTYLVYRPITNTFLGDDLRNVLQDISFAAGVVIVPDANVAGEVYVTLENVPLDTALDMVLDGSPFEVKKEKTHYLVADRHVTSDAFWRMSETRNVRLNYMTPKKVADLLSSAFSQYVKADDDPNSRVISVTATPRLAERIVADIRRLDTRPRHVILEARVVVMERSDLLDLGVEWGWPKLSAGTFRSDSSGGALWGAALGYTADATFTDSLLLALNLLQENEQADIIAKPVVTAQDGKMSDISVIDEEYFMLQPQSTGDYYVSTEMVTITSGTKLQITPHIGDNNDITLEIATEVSESIPAAAATDLPVVTRRQSRNVTTVKDGGTVALAGLTRTHSKQKEKKVPGLSSLPLVGGLFQNTETDQSTQEVAVFVTASLVHEVPDRLTTQDRREAERVAEPAGSPMSDNDPLRNALEARLAPARTR